MRKLHRHLAAEVREYHLALGTSDRSLQKAKMPQAPLPAGTKAHGCASAVLVGRVRLHRLDRERLQYAQERHKESIIRM